MKWQEYKKGNYPEFGVEVLGYNEKWKDEFTPMGIRIGYKSMDEGFVSSRFDADDDNYYTTFNDNPIFWIKLEEMIPENEASQTNYSEMNENKTHQEVKELAAAIINQINKTTQETQKKKNINWEERTYNVASNIFYKNLDSAPVHWTPRGN